MHKPDPKLPPEAPDKRSVVPLATGAAEAWLFGSVQQAAELIRLAPVEWFDAGPAVPPPAQGSLL